MAGIWRVCQSCMSPHRTPVPGREQHWRKAAHHCAVIMPCSTCPAFPLLQAADEGRKLVRKRLFEEHRVLCLEPASNLGCKLGRCQRASERVVRPTVGLRGVRSAFVRCVRSHHALPAARALEPIQFVIRDNPQQALRIRRNSLHRLRKVQPWPSTECWPSHRAVVRLHAPVGASTSVPSSSSVQSKRVYR